jgi:DNA-binding transcriptional LysR family regulator
MGDQFGYGHFIAFTHWGLSEGTYDLSVKCALDLHNDFQLFIFAMSDRIFALRVFLRVARLGSFSAGGRDLAVPQPTVSRIISRLESELGAALFTRTTRAVTLTDAGADFLARVEPILTELEEAEHAVRGNGELRGILRVGLSSSFAIREVAPRLPEFMDRHPKLRVELITNDQRQDFVSEGVDVGMRFGPLTDSTATARRVAALPRIVLAAPSYLERVGAPKTPTDLTAHSVIVTPSRLGRSWSFTKKGKATSVTVQGRLVVTSNEVGLAAAVAGLGLASMTIAAAKSELADGRLVQVLSDWDMGEVELHAVFPAGKAAKPSARAFVDFLTAELAASLGGH